METVTYIIDPAFQLFMEQAFSFFVGAMSVMAFVMAAQIKL